MAAVVGDDLCDNEKLVFEAIQKGDVNQLINLMNGECRVNCVDANGMSPLQHAAYRGNREICDMLLDAGADVNCSRHSHGYTALMFAALSGNVSVVARLLEAGANINAVNTVKRTSAQMAAFVGNHICVGLINNFIPRSSVEYYTRPQGLETEGKLSPHLVTPLHRLLLSATLHPVAVALFLVDHPSLYWGGEQAARILRLMCEQAVKRSNANEVMALKYHFLAFFIAACRQLNEDAAHNRKLGKSKSEKKLVDQDMGTESTKKDLNVSKKEFDSSGGDPEPVKKESNTNVTKSDPEPQSPSPIELNLDDVIRHWLKTRDTDDVQENMEKLIRAGIRDFPYPQCTIIQQLVRNLSTTWRAPAGEAPPTALALLTTSVSGNVPHSEEDDQCEACGVICKAAALKRCVACRAVRYCDRRCQRLHWGAHRKWCARLAEETKQTERLRQAADTSNDNDKGEAEPPVAPPSEEEVVSVAATVGPTEFEPSAVSIGDTSPEE